VGKKNPGPNLGFRTSTFRTWTDKKKNPLGINPGQPAGKGREKKTLVPIWVSGPRLSGSRQTKKKKKTLVLTLGSPPVKGEKKKKKKTLVPI
jgi:hypothetical protein